MLKEAQWSKTKYVPTIDEYMANAYVSFALGPIVLPTLYLVGPELPTDLAENSEYNQLFELMSTSGRLLNDFNGYKVYPPIFYPLCIWCLSIFSILSGKMTTILNTF